MTLAELVSNMFLDVWDRNGGEVYVNCCWCADQKHRLGINVSTGVAHCFKCDTSSGDKKSVVNSKRRTFNKICTAFNYAAQFTLDEGEVDTSVEAKQIEIAKTKPKQKVQLPKEFEPLWEKVNDRVSKQARAYLTSRRISLSQIKRHKIGFAAGGSYAYRIIFPIYYRKELRGYVCRDFTGEGEPKYLNSHGEKGLYNVPSKNRRKRCALLVEGVFDVLSCLRANLPKHDVLGGLGSKLTPLQLKILKTYNTIDIWVEPDRAGVEGAIKRWKQLRHRKRIIRAIMPLAEVEEDTDPGNMLPDEIEERVKGAVIFTSGIAALMRNRIALAAPVKQKKPFVKKDSSQ